MIALLVVAMLLDAVLAKAPMGRHLKLSSHRVAQHTKHMHTPPSFGQNRDASEDASNCTTSHQPLLSVDSEGRPQMLLGALGKPVEGVRVGQLLLSKGLDGIFENTVVLLTRHDNSGSEGFIVNRMLSAQMAKEWDMDAVQNDREFYGIGGPVEDDEEYVVHTVKSIRRARAVLPGIYVGGSVSRVKRRVQLDRRHRYKVLLGISRWALLQLDGELRRGNWLNVNAVAEDVFLPPDGIWNELMRRALSAHT
eukprot:NODE_2371_length_935_cov_88.484199_g1951_i0.p1 GENE.NODE_2371_length_935_cov_88.484199_g1951_i0~~NODE_2371_length_935_cov_88.484199_g1951_i0.p1  ORF type:complete len:269 (+),score=70.99 NODE_2371_length_935_cov_88.484199_g1951_i0:55-807(+)